jgi:hypothetical protein
VHLGFEEKKPPSSHVKPYLIPPISIAICVPRFLFNLVKCNY